MTTSLPEFLNEAGYVRISLSRSGVGHFHSEGKLNERPITVLIDTGADTTIISLGLAKEMNLPMTQLSGFAGGAGSTSLEIHQVDDAHFQIGPVSPKIEGLYAMDFSHVNEALADKGSSPVDAIAGVNIFEVYKAVIDYDSSSLYLKV